MIKVFCNYCEEELKGTGGGELTYVKVANAVSGQPRPTQFNEHLCAECLEKAQKALETKKKA